MPSFKKIISVLCAAAMTATMAVMPVMAAELVVDKDYAAAGAVNDWVASDAALVIPIFTEGAGLTLDATGNDKRPSATLKLGSAAIESSVLMEYDMQVCRRGDNDSTLTIGSDTANIVSITFGKTAQNSTTGAPLSGTVNGEANKYTGIPTGGTAPSEAAINNSIFWTDFIHFKHIINMDAKTVETVITSGDTEYYNATNPFVNTAADAISKMTIAFGKMSAMCVKDIQISTVAAPTITIADFDEKQEAGTTLEIAELLNAENVEVTSSASGFTCSESSGKVSVAISDSLTGSTSTEITINATSSDGISITKKVSITAIPVSAFAQEIANSIKLTGSSVTETEDGYALSGDVTLTTAMNGANIAWESDSRCVVIEGSEAVINMSAGTEATLTAHVTYKGYSADREFKVTLTTFQQYYDESFDSWKAAQLVKLSGPSSDKQYDGWEFYVGSRGDGGNGGIAVVKNDNDGVYLSANAAYGDSNRSPYIYLSNAPAANQVSGAFVVKFKLRFGGEIPVTLSDGDSGSNAIGANQAVINMSNLGLKSGKWYDVTYAITRPGSEAALVINDSEGVTAAAEYYTKNVPSTISRIDFGYNARYDTNADIDNLSMFKTSSYAVPKLEVSDTSIIYKGESASIATVKNATDENCTVTVSGNGKDAFEASIANGVVTVKAKENAQSGAKATISVKAEADTTVVSSFDILTIARADVLEAEKAVVQKIPYSVDPRSNLTAFEPSNGAVIFGDLVFPTTSSVELYGTKFTPTVKWTVESGAEYISPAGVISVPDTDKHAVTLKRTVSYGGESMTTSYDMFVQFKPEDVTAVIEPLTTAENKDSYLRAFVYDYQVKLDRALASNFSTVPTSLSDNTTFALPTTGVFGSKFEWYSGNTAVVKVSNSDAKATVVKPSLTTKVSLSAYVTAGTAERQEYITSIDVIGTNKNVGNVGGGGGSYNGGSTKPQSGSSVATPVTGNVSITPNNTPSFNPNPSGFTDLGSVDWALTAINNLYVNGVISGKTATQFCPNDNVTRAEFAKILVNAFNIPATAVNGATFTDVSTSHWASQFVETAYAKGVVTGYDNGAFDPDAYVTRQDMAVMILRAAESMGYSFEAKAEAVTFTDAANIASYAKTAIETLQKAGVANGVGDGNYEPLSTSTRAQACQMIYNVFNK